MDLRYVIVTNCNANCYFCLNEYIGSKSSVATLSPQNYGDLSSVARELGVEECTITGGEPTLRRDLGDIVSKVRSSSLKPTVVSNGYLLKDHAVAWGLVEKLHVSFHSFDEVEWERITKVKNGPQIVQDNLVAIRGLYPNLTIRLNVVTSKENSSRESLNKYLGLARRIGINISVFQNGYLRLLKEIGRLEEKYEEHNDFWELDSTEGELIEETRRIRTFDFNGIKINLTYLSSEMHNGSTFWVTPIGEGFADIRKRSPLIDFNPSLSLRDFDRLRSSYLSLFKEAELLKEMELKGIEPLNHPEYIELVNERNATLDTTKNKYFF